MAQLANFRPNPGLPAGNIRAKKEQSHYTLTIMRNQATTITTPVENQILNTISWTLNVSTQRLLPYMHFADDLHLDDIDLLLLIATIENQTGVYLTGEQAASIQTIGDVTRYFSVN